MKILSNFLSHRLVVIVIIIIMLFIFFPIAGMKIQNFYSVQQAFFWDKLWSVILFLSHVYYLKLNGKIGKQIKYLFISSKMFTFFQLQGYEIFWIKNIKIKVKKTKFGVFGSLRLIGVENEWSCGTNLICWTNMPSLGTY